MSKKIEIKIIEQCVFEKKVVKVGKKLTVDQGDGLMLIGSKKAELASESKDGEK